MTKKKTSSAKTKRKPSWARELATKRDLAALRIATKRDMADLRTAMTRDIAGVRSQMATKDDLAQVRKEMATKDDLAQVRKEMATTQDFGYLMDEFGKFSVWREEMDGKMDSWKEEIVRGFGVIVEELRHDLLGAYHDNIGVLEDARKDHDVRIRKLEQVAGLAA